MRIESFGSKPQSVLRPARWAGLAGGSPAASSQSPWGAGPSGVRGAARAHSSVGNREDPSAQPASGKDQGYKPMVKCVLPSCDALAGESPVRVMAKQPGSWWPVGGEILSLKRHDKAALGGEQATSPYDEEPCSLVTATMWEPSLFHCGEGHGRREELGMRSAYVSTGVWRAEWLHSASRNRGDPSRHRRSPMRVVALRHSVIAGSGEAYKQLDCEVAERRAEVGPGHSSDERRNNRTRRSEGPVAGWATRSEGLRACCDAIHPSTAWWPGPGRNDVAWGVRQRTGTAECGRSTARGKAG